LEDKFHKIYIHKVLTLSENLPNPVAFYVAYLGGRPKGLS